MNIYSNMPFVVWNVSKYSIEKAKESAVWPIKFKVLKLNLAAEIKSSLLAKKYWQENKNHLEEIYLEPDDIEILEYGFNYSEGKNHMTYEEVVSLLYDNQ